jgi:PAS domain S-box-containing protein
MKKTPSISPPPPPPAQVTLNETREIGQQPEQLPMFAELYRRAEARMSETQAQPEPEPGADTAEPDPRRLVHELQVHQIELQMQNAELHETQARLEASLDQFSDLYDFAPIGYFTLTAEGIIRQLNLRGAELAGMERGRLVGHAFGNLLSTKSRPTLASVLKQLFAEPGRQGCDLVLQGKGRPTRFITIKAQRSANGTECRVVAVDTSERKRAEELVQSSELRYRRLFEAAHDGVLLMDPATRKITDANPFMTKLLDYPVEQLIGKELFEIGLLKDEGASQEMFRQLKRQKEIRYEDLPLESRTGRHREVEVVANVYDEGGQSVIQCNVRDITARKETDDILRRNQALFSALIDQAPYGVYVLGADLHLLQVNRHAAPTFAKIKHLVGRSFSEVLRILWPRRVADQMLALFRHTLKTGHPYHSPDFAERRRDTGRQEIYEWQIQRVTMPAGEFAAVVYFRDITERRRAEEERRRLAVLTASNKKLEREIIRRQGVEQSLRTSEEHQRVLLEQARQMQAELRSLSHQTLQVQEDERKRISRELHDDITQTLVNINFQLESLSQAAEISATRLRNKITLTRHLVEKSVGIVHEFARELRPPALDHLGLSSALQSFMKEFMKRTGIRVHFTIFAGVEQLNSASRTVLYRVIHSALTNVAQHAKASRVNVILEKRRGKVSLQVEDDGTAFDPSRVMLRKGKRNRLGLIGMRERVEMIGGTFNIQSNPGKGTTILAEIPFVTGT